MLNMRTEPSALFTEISVWRSFRRPRLRQQRDQARVYLTADVDNSGIPERLIAVFLDRLGIDYHEFPLG